MGQDPYGGGDFTPYEPGGPAGEPPAGEPPAPPPPGPPGWPYLPYGAAPDPATGAPPIAAPRKRRVWPWLLVAGLVVLIGLGCLGIVGIVASIDDEGSSGDLATNDLTPGQCLVGTGLEPGEEAVGALKAVSCTDPHDAEVVAVNPLNEDEASGYDFDDPDSPFNSCEPYFSARAKKLLQRQDLYLIALTESSTPSAGDQVACLLVHADGSPLEGPVIDLVPGSVMPSPTV